MDREKRMFNEISRRTVSLDIHHTKNLLNDQNSKAFGCV